MERLHRFTPERLKSQAVALEGASSLPLQPLVSERIIRLHTHQHYSLRLAAIKVEEQGCSGATERGVFRPVITS